MINWQNFVFGKETKTKGFRTERLAYSSFVSCGVTAMVYSGDSGDVEIKRYQNYKSIIEKGKKNSWMSFSKENNYTEIFNMQSQLLQKSYEEVFARELEEYDLSYSQLDFESREQEVESEIISMFSLIKEVLSIYSFPTDESTLHIQILTNNIRYDRKLMMRLLDIEYDVRQRYKNISLSFDYIPKVYNLESDVVVEGAKQIYKKDLERGLYEFRVYTFTTSPTQQGFSNPLIFASSL